MTHYEPRHPRAGGARDRPGLRAHRYAIAKYGFILLIVIAILWFLAAVVIPAFT